jgi:methionyl-tRNA synthetase
VLSLIFKNCDGYLPVITGHTAEDNALFVRVGKTVTDEMPATYSNLALSQALDHWMQAVFACNAYIDVQAPWAQKKTDPARMETVLATLYICIAQLAVAVIPVLPDRAGKLLDQMGIPVTNRGFSGIGAHWYSFLAESDFRLEQPQGLFPRLELIISD